MMLPPLDASIEDKLMLFKINMPQCLPKTEAQRAPVDGRDIGQGVLCCSGEGNIPATDRIADCGANVSVDIQVIGSRLTFLARLLDGRDSRLTLIRTPPPVDVIPILSVEHWSGDSKGQK